MGDFGKIVGNSKGNVKLVGNLKFEDFGKRILGKRGNVKEL